MEIFDLIFFTGVLYNTIEHFKIFNILRRLKKDDGLMLLQTSIDKKREEPVILMNWKEADQKRSYAYLSKSALFKMLAILVGLMLHIMLIIDPNATLFYLYVKNQKNYQLLMIRYLLVVVELN